MEPLKNSFGPFIPKRIAAMIVAQYQQFPSKLFISDCLKNYDSLELMPRARQIAHCLGKHLPQPFDCGVKILLRSLGEKLQATESNGMSPFLYLPHVFYVAYYGLDHFEPSMKAQYELTQRFTAEFSIRPFIERYPERTLDQLRRWASDKNVHVRRLVSEGTRPRLPWAPRLREFQRDPTAVIELLDLLKDDPDLYVRRSVANNLNDIGKDHPSVLVQICHKWSKRASQQRLWIIRHALRTSIKRGDQKALALLGYHGASSLKITNIKISPQKVKRGSKVTVSLGLNNRSKNLQAALIDLKIHFVKANNKTSAKVFKLKEVKLIPGTLTILKKTIGLHEMTTRRHYPGVHRIDLLINGECRSIGKFVLM